MPPRNAPPPKRTLPRRRTEEAQRQHRIACEDAYRWPCPACQCRMNLRALGRPHCLHCTHVHTKEVSHEHRTGALLV
jgi:hypothetical protein